jgi:putative membrane protein
VTDAPPLKPLLIERDEDPDAPTPASVPAVPDSDRPEALLRLPPPPGSALSRMALWVFGTLFTFVLSVAAWDFVTGLLSRDSLLGTVALVLVGLAVLMALALALRELAGFARMARIDTLRQRAADAVAAASIKEARIVVAGLESLYRTRPELAPARARVTARGAELFDADGLLSLAEAELMAPLDQSARREVEAAARQVATVTALVPLALADVATALYANLRMIRRIAAIYGGRSGTLGTHRLMRGVFTHLAATGALAVGDDMIHSVAGGGILSRISRRFGEGVVNGALTARIGVAAMDVCRPLPFRALPRPKTTNLVSRGLAGLFAETRES